MRPKVIVAVALIGCFCLFILMRIKKGANLPNVEIVPPTVEALKTSRSAETPKSADRGRVQGASDIIAGSGKQIEPGSQDSPIVQHQAYVEKRVEELMDLGMKDDSASLDIILSELTNRDPEIRKAAVEAAIQFGSRDAIPKLTDAASQTDDAKEKADIMDAIEFLKLPSASEVVAQSGGVKTPARKNPLLNKQNPAPSIPTSTAPR